MTMTTTTRKLVYKFLDYNTVGEDEWRKKGHRDYFWQYADGTLSAPLTMGERRALPGGGDDDAEGRQWAAYNRHHDR